MVTPLRTLTLLLLVFGFALLLMLLVPESGWTWRGWRLAFPTWSSFWDADREGQRVALDEFFEIYNRKAEDKVAADSAEAAALAYRLKMKHFQFPDDQVARMDPFFRDLGERCKQGRVRILHFGDSQIEGHRISGYLNRYFQSRFGGAGPGWIPVVEVIPTPVVRQSSSEEWFRYKSFGPPRSEAHKGYGLLGSFARFFPQPASMDTLAEGEMVTAAGSAAYPPDTLATREAWFSVALPRPGQRSFTRARLAFGNFDRPVEAKLWVDGALISTERWLPEKGLQLRSWDFGGRTPDEVRWVFEGTDSPDFYGLSLETPRGIFVDNIPMRGSSGTEFGKMDLRLHRDQQGDDDIALVILQFGGNALPGMTSMEGVEYYGRVMAAQISYLRKQFPQAVFMLIGPSDMSVKDGTRLVTYPFLPEVRDKLKETAFAQGVIYWDLYEVMGGRNSMPSWVAADPPLAAPDYVHFTPKGAEKVAQWLVEAFEEAELRWKNQTR